VVVVEAPEKSGALITVSFALEQGREVFAVPGSIESLRSRGTHFLIKQGARLVEDVHDILEEFGIETDKRINEEKAFSFNLTPQEKEIYDCLGEYPVHIDEIIRNTGMEPSEILSNLLKMELKGVITQVPGKMFIKGGRR
jgi:DNA processing protein